MENRFQNRKSKFGMSVGSSLVLVAFVLICIVAFAALSYSTAISDYRFTQEQARHQAQYYGSLNAEP